MRHDKTTTFFKVENPPNVNFVAGTLSKFPYKSCFLNIKATFKTEAEDRKFALRNTLRKISQDVRRNLNQEIFRDRFISDFDVADTFERNGRSFTKIEFTFFPKRETSKEELNDEMLKIQKSLSQNIFVDSEETSFLKQAIQNRTYAKKS